MPSIKEEDMLKDLDFKCAQCQAECTKINALEPDLGYISKVDGSFFGPLCQSCFDKLPDREKVVHKIPESAFLVIIRPNGEGPILTTEGIEHLFMREPSAYDVVSACNKVAKDLEDSISSHKLVNNIVNASAAAQKSKKIIVPK